MNFQSRIKQFKENNPELTQRTLRISKKDAKKIDDLAKREKIKSGHCLRILVEDAIAKATAKDTNFAPEKESSIKREEFESLKAQVEKLTEELGGFPTEEGNDTEEQTENTMQRC